MLHVCNVEYQDSRLDESNSANQHGNHTTLKALPLPGMLSLVRLMTDAGFIGYNVDRREVLDASELLNYFTRPPDIFIEDAEALPEVLTNDDLYAYIYMLVLIISSCFPL